jgi:nucleotide-binding universal stress UspA family protein
MQVAQPLHQQRILVPMDFSETSRVAFRAALHLANTPGDVVHLFYMPGLYAKTADDAALLNNPFSNTAELSKQHLRTATKSEDSNVSVEILAQIGIPDANTIANMAIRMKSTLIVVAKRKCTLWERLFSGSVTNKLSRIARCPVHFVEVATASAQTLRVVTL